MRFSFHVCRSVLIATLGATLALAQETKLQPADLIVTNARVVTMNDRRELHENGMVVIQGSRILAVGPVASLAQKFTAAKTIDAHGDIVMPGMINTHTHSSMTV